MKWILAAQWLSRLPWLLAVALYLFVAFRCAWVCDDAFVGFRTVDNFVRGYGLTWNTFERVQSFTDPLFLLLLSAIYPFTRELYYTSMFFSLALSAATVALFAGKIARSRTGALLGVLVLTFSIAFVDYSTSGLENPLTHLIVALFLWVYLTREAGDHLGTEPSGRVNPNAVPCLLSFLAAMGMVNRADTVLLFLPPLLHTFWRRRTWRCLTAMALGSFPFLAWVGFALFYYGFPFPNTAYAKLNNGVGLLPLVARGGYYLWNSVKWDPITMVTIVCSLGFACWRRSTARVCAALGILMYVLYVVRVGGDFMSGRFLTAPLLAAVVLLGSARRISARVWVPALLAIAVLGFLARTPTVLSGAKFGLTHKEAMAMIVAEHGVADERAFYYPGTGLLRALQQSGKEFPDFPWADYGRQMRVAVTAVQAEFPEVQPVAVEGNVGMPGYYAGPNVRIVDPLALTDAFLARLPPIPDPYWRMGHFRRLFPAGYLQTVRSSHNTLRDPGLAEYYDHFALITQGDLFDLRRLAAIWNMNLGRYGSLLEPMRRKILARVPDGFMLLRDPQEALDEFSRTIAREPENAAAYKARSVLYAGQGKTAEAIEDCDRVIELEPDNASAYNERGALYAHRDETAKAIGDFSRAIELEPDDPGPYVNRGALYANQNEPKMAVLDFSQAVRCEPADVPALINRAILYTRLRNWHGALNDAHDAISVAPWNPNGYCLAARTIAIADHLEAAYSEVLDPSTDLSAALNNLAWILATNPNTRYRCGADAVGYAKCSLATAAEQTPMLLDTLAAAYAEAGRFAEAATVAGRAIALALADGRQPLAERIRARLQLYQGHKAYHLSEPKEQK